MLLEFRRANRENRAAVVGDVRDQNAALAGILKIGEVTVETKLGIGDPLLAGLPDVRANVAALEVLNFQWRHQS